MVEGLGLWWEKRWAEYVVVAATFSAVPFEIIALVRHLSFTRLTALLVNLAVAVYLIHCLRKPRAGLGSAQPSLIGPLILMAVLVAALAAPRTASGPRDSRPSSGRPSLSRAPPADRRLTNAAEGLDSLVESRRRRTLPWASRRCPPSCPQCRRILAR
jgi:hypothetical protein